jgi:hypothetical protein
MFVMHLCGVLLHLLLGAKFLSTELTFVLIDLSFHNNQVNNSLLVINFSIIANNSNSGDNIR